MTIDEIIKTARNEYGIYAFTAEDLAAFIITIKNAEREECAKVAEEWQTAIHDPRYECDCSEVIRERKKND
jgi:hypothetical protein